MGSDVAVELAVLQDVVIQNTVFEGHSVDKCMSEDSSRAFELSTKLEGKKVLEDELLQRRRMPKHGHVSVRLSKTTVFGGFGTHWEWEHTTEDCKTVSLN